MPEPKTWTARHGTRESEATCALLRRPGGRRTQQRRSSAPAPRRRSPEGGSRPQLARMASVDYFREWRCNIESAAELPQRTLACQCRRQTSHGREFCSCSILVSTQAFVRIWRNVRKLKSVKFFVINTRQWCESHPLRHISLL